MKVYHKTSKNMSEEIPYLFNIRIVKIFTAGTYFCYLIKSKKGQDLSMFFGTNINI